VAAERDYLIPARLIKKLATNIGLHAKAIVVPKARHGFDEPWEAEAAERLVRTWLVATLNNPDKKS